MDQSATPLGATPVADGRTVFRVWAPQRQSVALQLGARSEGRTAELVRQDDGYFVGHAFGVGPGQLYRYLLDGHLARPDPASRYQPFGVHGPSLVVDPAAFSWTDRQWAGVAKRDLVIYELHVGAWTDEGTLRAALERLPALRELGVTAVELMPVAQSPGRCNWGYDGVGLFAVRNTYGAPDDLKALVDACHNAGLAVLLDVVYNHVGPEGNYLADFGPYFSRKHHTPWGEAFNFDGPGCRQVRRFIVDNAVRWLEEYHLDGLRLDAVHFMHDDSRVTILDELRGAVSRHAESAGRPVHLIAESNVYDHALAAGKEHAEPYDGIWCDCLMHSIYSLAAPGLQLSHRDYRGAEDVAKSLRRGFVYHYDGTQPRRTNGRPAADAAADETFGSLVVALQTHDAVGNHPFGKRFHQLTSKSCQRAAAALILLHPGVPLLFMGEEAAAEAPFLFFADFEDRRLQRAVNEGRAREFPQHVWGERPPPCDQRAFLRSRWLESEQDLDMLDWYRQLIAMRKQGLAEGWLGKRRLSVHCEISQNLFSLRYDCDDGGQLVVKARLSDPASAPQAKESAVSSFLDGRLLLSSEPDPEVGDGMILLLPNHAVVSRTQGR